MSLFVVWQGCPWPWEIERAHEASPAWGSGRAISLSVLNLGWTPAGLWVLGGVGLVPVGLGSPNLWGWCCGAAVWWAPAGRVQAVDSELIAGSVWPWAGHRLIRACSP